ncbi:MAG: hypothetical protein ACK4SY_03975 [Pyrobaculum sp.]
MAVMAYVLLGAGVALIAFAVAHAMLLYFAEIPKSSITAVLPILGQQTEVKIKDVPDPYYVGTVLVRAMLLLTIGVIGGKLLDTGITQWRESRREKMWQHYNAYQQEQY